MKILTKDNLIIIAMIQVVVATLGSLFFSEIIHFIPCVLCWYQRICMYPLVVILAVGIYEKNKNIHKYVLPLSITGMVVAFYHNLLYYNMIPESAYSCQAGISCTTKYIEWLGFITIPLLSFIAFTVINICMIIYARRSHE